MASGKTLILAYISRTLTLTCTSGNIDVTSQEERNSFPLCVAPLILIALYLKLRKDERAGNNNK